MKKIPKSFKLGGHTFKVTMVTDEEMQAKCRAAGYDKGETDAYGLFMPDRLQIFIQKPDRKLRYSVCLQTFWHEFGHALLWVMDDKRQTDEKYVDQLGHYFHQATQSFTY